MRGPGRCAVIGAGVLGVCVAARLAEAGVGVTLLEQDRPGHAATAAHPHRPVSAGPAGA